MAWQPEDEPLRQLAVCLRDSLNGQDRAALKQAEQVSFGSTLLPLHLIIWGAVQLHMDVEDKKIKRGGKKRKAEARKKEKKKEKNRKKKKK